MVKNIFSVLGNLNELMDFVYEDETEVSGSCSAILNGEMFVFGGWDEKRQISKVENCTLKRIGTLPMDFRSGACNTYQGRKGEWHVLLCFGIDDKTGCHR